MAVAQYRQQAKEAAKRLADLRAQRPLAGRSSKPIAQKQRELEAGRAAANERAAALREEVGRLIREG